MAKEIERQAAYEFYVKQQKSAKETARLVRVTQKTIGGWVKKHKWKERRDVFLRSTEKGLYNLELLIEEYSTKLREMERDPDSSPDERFKLIQSIRNLSKTKDDFQKDNKPNFGNIVTISDEIMSGLIDKIPSHKTEILDFFEGYILKNSK